MNKNSETYRSLAAEATEFLLWCLKDQEMKLKDIEQMYLSKNLSCLSYGALLQQLINDHIESHVRISNKELKESDYV